MTALDGELVPFPTATGSGDRSHSAGGYKVPVSAGPDATAPTITNMTPAPGVFPGSRYTASRTPIEFDVEDPAPGIRLVLVTLKYARRNETLIVYDGSQFVYPFDSGSSLVTSIANGYHFKVLPRAGWESDLDQLWVYALDSDGNMEDGLP